MKAKLVMRIGRSRSRAAVHGCFGGQDVLYGEFLLLLGELHDQHGVLHAHAGQHYEAYLREDVVIQTV